MQTDDRTSVTTVESHSASESPGQLELDIQLSDDGPSSPSRPAGIGKKSPWPIVILVMLVVGGLFGWKAYSASRTSNASQPVEPEKKVEASLPVRAVRAKLAPIKRWVTSPDGDVRVERYKQLIFEANGEVTYLAKKGGRYLREGDFVRKGQLLATIDDRKYRSDIRAAAADQEVAKRTEDQAIASLRQSEANLQQAKADLELAKLEAKRRQQLFSQGVIAETDRDTFNNKVVQAEVGVKVAQQNVKSAQDQIVLSRASSVANQAKLYNTTIAREDTQLVSPINGIVAYLNIREGEYWSSSRVQAASSYQDAIESVPIVVVDPSSFEVAMELPATEGSLLRPGQPAYIALDEDISQAFINGISQSSLVKIAKAKGTVFSVTPAVTPGGRAVQVRVRINDGRENLRIGARVQTWIAAQTKAQAITLPFGSVTTRDRKSSVFVVNEETGRVEQRPVVLDIEGLDSISIARGLQPGELVVTEGSNRLVNNSPVEVVSGN